MLIQPRPPLTIPVLFSPLVVAVVLVGLCALLKEPTRQKFSAIFLAERVPPTSAAALVYGSSHSAR